MILITYHYGKDLEAAIRGMILLLVLVVDPLAVLMLIAANWNMRNNNDNHWTDFFKKEKSEDFPETKEIIVEDNINLDDNPSVATDEELIFDEPEPEPKVKNWDPSFYTDANQTLGINSKEKELGRYETELLEQEKKRKVQSFLTKVGEIEQEVEDLQKRNN